MAGFLMSKFIAELLSGTQLNSAFARQPLEEEKPDPGKSDPPAATKMEAATAAITKQSRSFEMMDDILKMRRETAVGIKQSLKL